MIVQFQFRLSPPSRFVTDETSNGRASEGEIKREREREADYFHAPGSPSRWPSRPLAFFPTRANRIHREKEKRGKAPRLDGRAKPRSGGGQATKGWAAVSLEAATKGSGNYGEAANSREAEAKAAVGSQADLSRGFAPTFIRAARPFCAGSSVDARRRRPEFPPADPFQSHVSPSLSLYLLCQPPSTTNQPVSLLRFDLLSSPRPPCLFFRLEKPCD